MGWTAAEVDQAVAALAGEQHGMVARRQLSGLGMTEAMVKTRLRHGNLHRFHQGVFACGHRSITIEARWMAAVLAFGPDAALSHRSAGQLWGLVPRSRIRPEVTRRGRAGDRPYLVAHRGHLPADEVVRERGIPVTSVPRTMFDLAGSLREREVERAWNEMEVRGYTDALSVPDLLERYPGRQGSVLLARLADRKSLPVGITRNDFEEAFLALIDRHRLPRPRMNAPVALRGRFYEIDCFWEEQRVAIELDGGAVHKTTKAFHDDRERDRILTAEGYTTTRVTWAHLHETPQELADDLRRRTLCPMDRELFDHFLHDESRRGPSPDDAFTGAAGGAACGDVSRISLTVEGGRVASVTFDTEGCGATRAATAALAETIEGATILEAASQSIDDTEALLGGLELSKRHAAQLATDALHRALSAAAASDLPLDPATARVGPDSPTTNANAGGRVRSPERVAVAVSGGVDSAVAALLEKERGVEVIAITVKLWADPETDGTKACCSPEAVLGARAVAHSLELPHFTLDLEADFRRRVVSRFVDGYAEGQTPNPCILCNGEVRLAAMLDLAQRLGATRLLTGHYARIVEDAEGPLLAAGADAAKDQSYMLAALPPDLIGRLGFPLTEMTKEEVRAVAARHGLAVAKKPESQDLCFLAGQGKRGFLRRHGNLVDREGAVIDRSGRKLGRHRGHHNFTVGQRRGLGVSLNEPGYVVATDAAANTVTVGTREDIETRRIRVRDAVLHRDGARVDNVRLRYHSDTLPASVGAAAPGRHEALELELAEPFDAAAPGQTAVLMDGETIVGHGTIVAAV